MILVLLLAAAVVSLLALRAVCQHQVAGRIRISSPAGVDSLEKIQLGGVDQWIQIRGHDRKKPILLFLHGGPGFPNMPFAHVHAELEREFVVVQWDQRAAGKSYSCSIPDDSMRIAQFVSDAHELVLLLLRRFEVPKCYLVAHSWGSLFGAQLAARYPDLFHAYIGIGQAANLAETARAQYRFALESAQREGNRQAIAELERIGRPPHSDPDHKFMEKWVGYYSEREHPSLSKRRMIRLALESPPYSWLDLAKIPLGVKYSFQKLWREIFYEADLFAQAPRIEVPTYFFLGRYDKVVTAEVAEKYYNALDAPRGKHLIWFEHSGHWPHFEEPERFRVEVIRAADEALRTL